MKRRIVSIITVVSIIVGSVITNPMTVLAETADEMEGFVESEYENEEFDVSPSDEEDCLVETDTLDVELESGELKSDEVLTISKSDQDILLQYIYEENDKKAYLEVIIKRDEDVCEVELIYEGYESSSYLYEIKLSDVKNEASDIYDIYGHKLDEDTIAAVHSLLRYIVDNKNALNDYQPDMLGFVNWGETDFNDAIDEGIEAEVDDDPDFDHEDLDGMESDDQNQLEIDDNEKIALDNLYVDGETIEIVSDYKNAPAGSGIRVVVTGDDSLVYTGDNLYPNIKVYDGDTQLTYLKDYQIILKNSIKSASKTALNAPSATIKMIGQYSGQKVIFYEISKRNIDETTISGNNILSYNGRTQVFKPVVYYNSKHLTLGKDYTIEYEDPASTGTPGEVEEYRYSLTGIGNFTGTCFGDDYKYFIIDKSTNISDATLVLGTKSVKYDGTPITASDIGLKLKLPGTRTYIDPLSQSEYFDVYITNNNTPGSSIITVIPTDASAYYGSVSKSFKIVSAYKLSADAHIDEEMWEDEIPYEKAVALSTGMEQPYDQSGILKDESDIPLVYGTDYTVEYKNNKTKGTATAIFSGLGKYSGTISKTFKVTSGAFLLVDCSLASVPYTPAGATPSLVVYESPDGVSRGAILQNKTDYTVVCTGNRTLGTAHYTVRGIGNYSGVAPVTGDYTVGYANFSGCDIYAPDQPYDGTHMPKMSVPVITDTYGKKLTPGRDYDYDYTWDGKDVGTSLSIGKVIHVTITGIGNYLGASTTADYHIYGEGKKISDLYVRIDDMEYEGLAVRPALNNVSDSGDESMLARGQIHLYDSLLDYLAKTNELPSMLYAEVESYDNNTKVGSGKVTLRGVGEYGGTTTCSFKILKKESFQPLISAVKITKSKQTVYMGDTGTLTAEVTPATAENKTVVWNITGDDVLEITGMSDTTLNYNAKAIGSCDVTVTTQEGGKTDTIHIDVVKAKVETINLSHTSITGMNGEVFTISYDVEPLIADVNSVSWTSSDTRVATVEIDEQVGPLGQPLYNGHVQLHSMGTAVIRMIVNGGEASATCMVKVNPDPSTVVDVTDASQLEGLSPAIPNDGNRDDIQIKAIIKKFRGRNKVIYIPEGEYDIFTPNVDDQDHSISLTGTNYNNTCIVMDENTILKSLPNSSPSSWIFYFEGLDGLTISGGKLVGERYSHVGTAGEWGMGIDIENCKNVHISNMEIYNFWGDGIRISDNPNGRGMNEHVSIVGCNIHDNRRNNISITGGNYVTISNCRLTGARGVDPQFGLDIEPNYSHMCSHIYIDNTYFGDNGAAALGIITRSDDIVLTDCVISGNVYNMAGTNVRFVRTVQTSGGVDGPVSWSR